MVSRTKTSSADAVVRTYLESIHDLNFVSPELAELEEKVEAEQDVIKALMLRQAILDEQAQPSVEVAFIKHAKTWAKSSNVSGAAFREMGVPTDVLKQAGFSTKDIAGPTNADRSSSTPDRVTTEAVIRSIRAHKSGTLFTIAGLAEKTGASTATTSKALHELVGDLVKEPIDDPNPNGRGRAPKVYERV